MFGRRILGGHPDGFRMSLGFEVAGPDAPASPKSLTATPTTKVCIRDHSRTARAVWSAISDNRHFQIFPLPCADAPTHFLEDNSCRSPLLSNCVPSSHLAVLEKCMHQQRFPEDPKGTISLDRIGTASEGHRSLGRAIARHSHRASRSRMDV